MSLALAGKAGDDRQRAAMRFDRLGLSASEMVLLAIAAGTAICGQSVGLVSGRRTDIGVVTGVLGDLAALGILAFGGLLVLLFLDVARRRSPTPAKDMLTALFGFLVDRSRLGLAIRTAAIFTLFAAGFGELKGLAALGGYGWDARLMWIDTWLHLGYLPHEWLAPLFDWPRIVQLVNFVYNAWYFVMIAMVLALAIGYGSPRARFRFLLAFMATWLIGGVLIASIFSSAGPCYFGRLGHGGDYGLLMARLGAIDLSHPLYALSTQNDLWLSYIAGENASPISAFPSMHAATAMLIALYAWHGGFWARIASLAFLAAISLGSVLLAWHYAVDAYAGMAIAALAWWASGRIATRFGLSGRSATKR